MAHKGRPCRQDLAAEVRRTTCLRKSERAGVAASAPALDEEKSQPTTNVETFRGPMQHKQ